MSNQNGDPQLQSDLIAPDGQPLKTLEMFHFVASSYFTYLSTFDIDAIKRKPTAECTAAEYLIITDYNSLKSICKSEHRAATAAQ